MTWKSFATILLGLSLSACAHEARARLYVSQPAKGGLIRAQAKELIQFKDTEGFICISPGDFEIMVTEIGEQNGGDSYSK